MIKGLVGVEWRGRNKNVCERKSKGEREETRVRKGEGEKEREKERVYKGRRGEKERMGG